MGVVAATGFKQNQQVHVTLMPIRQRLTCPLNSQFACLCLQPLVLCVIEEERGQKAMADGSAYYAAVTFSYYLEGHAPELGGHAVLSQRVPALLIDGSHCMVQGTVKDTLQMTTSIGLPGGR